MTRTNSTQSATETSLAFIAEEIRLLDAIVGASSATDQIRIFVSKAALGSSTVLITGESGTGKELVAQSIHRLWSARNSRLHQRPNDSPFVVVNCGAIPESLIEAELFGYERGAFTGAVVAKPGLMEIADKGTLFLDEIGDLPFSSQVKLNRFLREGEIRRVGSTRMRTVNVRVIAATHKDLYRLLDKSFRQDLYYRLNILPIQVPPLRDRLLDIPCLVERFYAFYNSSNSIPVEFLDPAVVKKLQEQAWPGNVQQLYNVLERAAASADPEVSQKGDSEHLVKRLSEADFHFLFLEAQYNGGTGSLSSEADLNLSPIERAYITEAMRRAENNTVAAAQLLGISKHSLRRRLRELR